MRWIAGEFGASMVAGEVRDVEAAVGVYAIELMKPLREVGVQGQQFGEQYFFAIFLDGDIVEEIGAQTAGPPKDAGFRCRSIEDGLPLGF